MEGRERETEERKRHEIRNARYKLSREWNEINTSISAVTAAGVNKGLIEPEFAAKLACFELLDPKNRICALPFPLCFAARKEGPTDRPTTIVSSSTRLDSRSLSSNLDRVFL